MTNNTLFCGIALVAIGLVSFFLDTPAWDDRVNKYLDTHDAAVEAYKASPKGTEPAPNETEAELAKKRPNEKTFRKDPSKRSMTALIPSVLGALLLLVVGVVIYKPNFRKHAMHFAALVGLAALIGGIYALMGGLGEYNELTAWTGPSLAEEWPKVTGKADAKLGHLEQPKIRSGGMTALVGLIYVGLAVKSFIDARKAQAQAEPKPAA